MIQNSAAAFTAEHLAPIVNDAYMNETVNSNVFKQMGDTGLLGITLPEQYAALVLHIYLTA